MSEKPVRIIEDAPALDQRKGEAQSLLQRLLNLAQRGAAGIVNLIPHCNDHNNNAKAEANERRDEAAHSSGALSVRLVD